MARKLKLILSDLHFGAGRVAEGNALEDFTSDAELAALLRETAGESDRDAADVEVLFAGDTFEMLQIPHVPAFEPTFPYPPESYHSSAEADSVLKIEHAIAGHPQFFEAMGDFLQDGPPRRVATVIKGNHDINLHWPAVQDRIRQEMRATGPRAGLLAFEERRVSREGLYVEHGNQYGQAFDQVKNMDDPQDPDRPGQLALPAGSWLVMNFFNQVERQRYWIDGVKPITSLVWYALAYDFDFAVQALAELLRALPATAGAIVLDDTADANRRALLDELGDGAGTGELRGRYQSDPAFRAEFNARIVQALGPAGRESDREAAVAGPSANPAELGRQAHDELHSSLYGAAAARAAEESARFVIFGHTHEAGDERLPNGARYLNTGTWTWVGDFSHADPAVWRDLFDRPERYAGNRTLSYVRIDYDAAGEPSARLLTYRPAPPVPPTPEGSLAWRRLLAWLRAVWRKVFGRQGQ